MLKIEIYTGKLEKAKKLKKAIPSLPCKNIIQNKHVERCTCTCKYKHCWGIVPDIFS